MFKLTDDLSIISNEEIAFCDIETDGLYINPRIISIYQPSLHTEVLIYDFDRIDIKEITDKLSQMNTVWHNASYDLGTLDVAPAVINDTLYLAKQAFPQWKEYALDKVVTKLGFDYLYANIDKKVMQKAGFIKGAYLSHDQYVYAATDVIALSKIWENPLIQQAREIMSYKVDMLAMSYAIRFQQNGIPVDLKAVEKELIKVEEKIKNNAVILGSLNCNSPKQCKEALGTDSTDKPTMAKIIAEGNELAKAIWDQRRALKRKGFLESYNYPKVYTRYNVGGAITGRATTTGGDLPNGINMQQIPRDLQYMFKSTDPEFVTIKADYSTVELRLAAAIFRDPTMYQQLKNDMDLHIETAKMLIGHENWTKTDRQKAKAVNFGFVFGMGAARFQEYAFTDYGVTFSLEECIDIRNKYLNRYKAIAQYHKKVWDACSRGNYIYRTALGRAVMPRSGTDGINGPVQGSGGDLLKLAQHYLIKDNIKALDYINQTVYDSIGMTVPRNELEYWLEKLSTNMIKGWYELSKVALMYYKDIPIKVEISWDNEVKLYTA